MFFDFIGQTIKWLSIIISFPFKIIGYAACWFWAFIYTGWHKAEKHQQFLVALHDERKSESKNNE